MRAGKDVAKTYHPAVWPDQPGRGGGPLGGTGRNTVGPPGASKGPEVRRGKIYSFDAATYTAEVFVDDSPTAVTLPVAKNLAAGLLPATTKVAVLCFDPSDPDDAVVLGPYDGTPGAWITDTHIVWGTGANQVSAVDVPIADAGGHFTGTDVEAALQELGPGGVPDNSVTGAKINDGATFGASSKKLQNFVAQTDSNRIVQLNASSDTDFVATINSLPGGASVVYNAPSSGSEDTINVASASLIGNIVLHNTTRGDSALIDSVNTGTNTITLTANVPAGWQVGDTITARSQTCTGTTPKYYDLDLSGFLPATANYLLVTGSGQDFSAGGYYCAVHPYESYGSAKADYLRIQAAYQIVSRLFVIPVTSQRICFQVNASGSATMQFWLELRGWWEDAAT